MSKIAKVYSKHQQYLLILNPNIQTKPIYMLILGTLTYAVQIYM